VFSLIGRQLGSFSKAARALKSEGVPQVEAFKVSEQALSERLRAFPPILLYRVLMDVCYPQMHSRWQARQRPGPWRWPSARDARPR
jgi:hypothetical protein